MKLFLLIVIASMAVLLTTGGAYAADPHGGAAMSEADLAVEQTPAEAVAEGVLFIVADIGIVMLILSFLLCLMRVVKGPTLIDRGIATDTITLHVVGIAILLTIALRTLLFFDAVLIFAILGFATTVAFAQFIGRRGRAV